MPAAPDGQPRDAEAWTPEEITAYGRALGATFVVEGVDVAHEPGQGRVIRSRRPFKPDEQILVSECLVASQTPLEADGALRTAYKEVSRVCEAVRSGFSPEFYWAAFSTLLACDGPVEAEELHHVDGVPGVGRWELPVPVSSECQAQALQLYHPARLSPAGRGRDDDGGDMAAQALVEAFGLRCPWAKLQALVHVWKYNCFAHGDGPGSSLLFFMPSFMNHSCASSCCWWLDESGQYCLFAGPGGLAEGEELSISYLSTGQLDQGTIGRRELLACGWLFLCQCSRCGPGDCPTCSMCSCPHALFLAELERSPYEMCVDCDVCGQSDLGFVHSYFWHCAGCEEDVCPPCVERTCAVATSTPCN